MRDAPKPDDWYASEQRTRLGMITELQRIRRRTRVRPIPVLVLAVVITGAVAYKFISKKQVLEAEVVLALTEGSLANRRGGLPADQLREYVSSVLIPDGKLLELIERRNMFPLRKRLGNQFAIDELREQIEVAIWKNSFVYYDEEDARAQKSARIGLTVLDTDPDRAYDIAHDLAAIAIASHDAERQKLGEAVASQVELIRKGMELRLEALAQAIAAKQVALTQAQQTGVRVPTSIALDLARLLQERKTAQQEMSKITTSKEDLAGQVSAAGLDMTLEIVGEHRPPRPVQSEFTLIMIIVVIGTGSLLGAAMLVGAFDSRIHDTDDVERLGLPVLGHVPGFAGDHVGALRTRSVMRARVPSFLRWRSHR
jgi:hypothetical protein